MAEKFYLSLSTLLSSFPKLTGLEFYITASLFDYRLALELPFGIRFSFN